MSSVTISIEGLDEMARAIQNAKKEVREAVQKEVQRSTYRVQTAAVRRIQRGPATGETYEKYNPRRTHTASSPGQSPQSDTGRLAASVENRVDDLTGIVFTRVEYGKHLEFGTANMAARPWLLPSLEEESREFARALREILK